VGNRGRDVRQDPTSRHAPRSATSTVAIAPARQSGRDPLPTVPVTDEIPAVPAPPTRAPASPAPPRARRPRRAAPVPLRQFVWFLFFVLVLCGAGLWALHARPSWFAFLRNKVPSATPVLSTGGVTPPSRPVASLAKGTASSAPTATTAPRSTFHLATASSQTGFVHDTYDVGVSSFDVTVSTSAPCWVVIKSPADAAADVVEATEPPGFRRTVPATAGSASVEVAAHGSTIVVTSGNRVLGTLADLHIGDYTFKP
jgi:hypothetical protein